ncbi:MAG: sigma-54-dependent Fis family transcriptional regulator [Bacillota bacterium]|nr:sigma-54-dependent Fis family transcriptional regulator [Bacillota bacterium]
MTKILVSRFDNIFSIEKKLESIWKRFLVEGVVPEDQRTIISTSWERCKGNQLNPLMKETQIIYSDCSLDEKKEQHEYLLSIVKPYMEEIFNYFSEYMAVTLSDHKGVIYEGIANDNTWKKLKNLRFEPGADWSEEVAGTNAIGTALIEGRPVQVFSAEHYCQGWHPWICSAAPIRDPFSNQIIGVLNITAEKRIVQAHNIFLVDNQVKRIEQALGSRLMQQNIFSFASVLDSFQDPFVMFDMDGQITRYNEAAQYLLQISTGQSIFKFIDPSINHRDLMDMSKKGLHSVFRKKDGSEWRLSVKPYQMGTQVFGGMAIFQKMGSHNRVSARQKENGTRYRFDHLLTKNLDMIRLTKLAQKASFSDKTVLITGETGTGKEVLAQSIHCHGSRQRGVFVGVNCGAIPKELLASELFGYEGGAFTGAKSQGKKGKFLLADKGTIFLDEIGELPMDAQVYLLRVLEERVITRVGGSESIPIDVRIIAATHKDLKQEIKNGNFREDLFHRLNVIPLSVPPLRERKEDIPLLVSSFFQDEWEEEVSPHVVEEVWKIFNTYSWPGNIRQLKNVVDQALFRSEDGIIRKEHLPKEMLSEINSPPPVNEVIVTGKWAGLRRKNLNRDILIEVLQNTNGSVAETAKLLNVSRMTIYRKLKELQLD